MSITSIQIKKEAEEPVPVSLFMNTTVIEELAQKELKRIERNRLASYRYRIRKQNRLEQCKNEREELIARNLMLISELNALEKKVDLFKNVIQRYMRV